MLTGCTSLRDLSSPGELSCRAKSTAPPAGGAGRQRSRQSSAGPGRCRRSQWPPAQRERRSSPAARSRKHHKARSHVVSRVLGPGLHRRCPISSACDWGGGGGGGTTHCNKGRKGTKHPTQLGGPRYPLFQGSLKAALRDKHRYI